MYDSRNHPFYEVAETASKLVEEGHTVFQKFTCEKCGQRLTMPDANVFHKTGTCDQCGTLTDIEKTGCNYIVYMEVRKKDN